MWPIYNVKSRENHWVKKKDPFSLLHDITHLKDVAASYERKIKNTTWLKDLMKISLLCMNKALLFTCSSYY